MRSGHWACSAYNKALSRLEHFDRSHFPVESILDNLRELIIQCGLEANAANDTVWGDTEIGEQHDNVSCGMYVCMTAKYLALSGVLDFTDEDMFYFRKLMALEILNGHIIVAGALM